MSRRMRVKAKLRTVEGRIPEYPYQSAERHMGNRFLTTMLHTPLGVKLPRKTKKYAKKARMVHAIALYNTVTQLIMEEQV